jgi:phospholipid-transporting ATPase
LFDVDQPFANEGVVPAGFSGGLDKQSSRSPGGGGYAGGASANPFDDDDGPAAYSFSGPGQEPYANRYKRSRWQRFKEDHLTDVDWTFGVNAMLGRKSKFDGVPREILLNDPEANRVKGYEGNSVNTGKYGPITFLPKFLFCESCVFTNQY